MIKHLKIHDKDGRPCFVEVDTGEDKDSPAIKLTKIAMREAYGPDEPLWKKVAAVVGWLVALFLFTLFILLPIFEFLTFRVVFPITDKLLFGKTLWGIF